MGKRIGKYKVSDRESELSLADGGTVGGNLVVTGNINQTAGTTTFHQTHAIASGSSTSTNAFTGVAGTLTEAAHAGKVVIIPDNTANATLRIPTPSKAVSCLAEYQL